MTDPTSPPGASTDAAADTPAVRVLHGCPTAAEVAALAVVLAATAGDGSGEAGSRHTLSAWSSRERALLGATAPAAGGWRASALPR